MGAGIYVPPPDGAVAKLGKRPERTQEVRGSSTLSSTVHGSLAGWLGNLVRGGWCVVADGGVTGLSRGRSSNKENHAPHTTQLGLPNPWPVCPPATGCP